VAGNVTAQATRPFLHATLGALPPGDRDVLLIAWEQLTYEEVSRALGTPVGTVRSRLHRARAQTRRMLAGTVAAATYEEITTNE
jgi:RNA polymerase sigma-70 factor (ECF subfamily)